MIRVYKHPEYYYDLESVTRFANITYTNNINEADYIAIASSHNKPVFENITKPILYSYIREHPYEHDEYLQTQFASLKPNQNITIFSLSSFEKFAPGRKNIIIDQFELDTYYRLFVNKECETINENVGGSIRFLFLGGKANKSNRKPLFDMIIESKLDQYGRCSLFNVTPTLDNAKIENNHYLGYPYDPILYRSTNLSLIAETHFDGNQEFHPTEKTYRAIANCHPFIIASTPFFLKKLKDKGYQTFSHLINENYDFCLDHNNRLSGVLTALREARMLQYSSFSKVVNHNVKVLKANANTTLQTINNHLNSIQEIQ